MADKNEKFLKPLKDICLRIVAEPEECSTLMKQLSEYAAKGAFYEHHVFAMTLQTITNNPDLPSKALKDIFKMLKQMLNDGSNNKDSVITVLYNFMLQNKNRKDLFNNLVYIGTFEADPLLSTKTEVLFLITEVMLKHAEAEDSCEALYSNYQNHIKNYSQHEELSLKLLKSMGRTTSCLIYEKKWDEVVTFLDETLVRSAVSGTLRIPNDEAYEEILNIMMNLVKYSQRKPNVYQLCFNFTNKVSGLLTGKILKQCNDILCKMFTMCHKGKISAEGIKSLYSTHYQKVESKSILEEKTALFLGKLLENNIQLFEATPDFFYSYHRLAIGLFNVFKYIKNKEGVVSCCNDIKRHSTNNMNGTVMSLAAKTAKAGNHNENFGKTLLYHATYSASLVEDLKCQSKQKEMISTYERLYQVIYEVAVLKGSANLNLSHLGQCADVLLKLWDKLPEEIISTSIEPDRLVQSIYKNPITKEDAEICANGVALLLLKRKELSSYLDSSRDQKKNLMKMMFELRQCIKLLEYDSATEYLRTKHSSTTSTNLSTFTLIEMTAVSRYEPEVSTKVNSDLFPKLCNLTKCPLTLAQACQSISDEVIKKIPIDLFKKVNKLLEFEENKQFNLEVSLSLALNNYWIFFVTAETVQTDMKDKSVGNLNLKEELEILKRLNESLRHFTEVVAHISKHKKDVEKIMSTQRLIGIINNMAIQFYIRGIKYKDLEAFTLLWHITLIDGQQLLPILNVATFFLDHVELLTDSSGNYIKMSKKIKPLTIHEIVAESNALVDERYMMNFEEQLATTQYSVWSYLLSLWVYYLQQGRHVDGQKRWNQFKTTWKSPKTSDKFCHRQIIEAKMYFCLVEINMKCCQRTAVNFLSQGVSILVRAKKVSRDFVFVYYQIYNHISMKVLNYSLNRLVDMTHYNSLLASMISSTTKRGHCVKLIDLLSLSIMRNLSMEKIENAKAQLSELTMIIGLKEEILVESPLKIDLASAVVYRELFKEQVRKVELPPDSPLKSEFSMIYQDQSSRLAEQLKSFIHKEHCKCEICAVPQLKFNMFQIGCHYSRLMWLMNKCEVSRDFNEFAFHSWRNFCDKLRRLKDSELFSVNKIDFAVFSTRWLFQSADTLVTLETFEEIEDIYQEVELICTNNIPDFDCFKEILHARKENLNFLLEHNSSEPEELQAPSDLSFNAFVKSREKSEKGFSTPELMMNRPVQQKSQDSDVIYIDSDSDSGSKSASAKPASKPSKSTVSLSSKPSKLRAAPTPKPVPKLKVLIEPTPKKSTRRAKPIAVDEAQVTTSTRKTRRMV